MAEGYIDDVLAENLRAYYCVPYERHKEYHQKMLIDIVDIARSSKVYEGRLPDDVSIERLNDIPMTSHEDIEAAIQRNGLDRALLAKPEKYWQTSGYTGTPKKVYYGPADIERINVYILELLYLTGVFESDAGIMNLGETDPYLPGTLFDDCFTLFGERASVRARYYTCTVTDEQGFIRALRMMSGAKGVNVMLSFPIIYYLVATVAEHPRWLEDKAAKTISRLSFLPFRVMPEALARALARIYLRDVDAGHITGILRGIKFGYAYGEHIGPYKAYVDEHYPSMKLHGVLGSTEMIMQAFHLSGEDDEMCVPLKHYIPEIAVNGHDDVIPWYRWEKGMKGELIITRPGECLPLIRYPTGDLIEVVDPRRVEMVIVKGNEYNVALPVIKVLGRVVDAVDFDAPAQPGTFFGYKFYVKNVDDAMRRARNVRWWELYRLHGSPGRFMLWVIPEKPVADMDTFTNAIVSSLLRQGESQSVPFGLAKDLGALDVVISRPEAYAEIEKGIERRVREGRPLGRIKPRHVFKLDDEAEYARILNEKKKWAA